MTHAQSACMPDATDLFEATYLPGSRMPFNAGACVLSPQPTSMKGC